MISPPRRGDLYPGRLPSVRAQWQRLQGPTRVASVAVPLVLVVLAIALDRRAGATIAVLVAGMAAATLVYAKNRTDRHNAAVDRGEIRVLPDPRFRPASPDEVPAAILRVADGIGSDPGGVGKVTRFEGGWIVRRPNPRDVAVVVGDDGGWARFDPRTVSDLWAVGEYLAGRGRDG